MAGFREAPSSQDARFAGAAGRVAAAVAAPCVLQGCVVLDGGANDVRLRHLHQRRFKARSAAFDALLGGQIGDALHGVEVFWPTVGVARVVHGVDAEPYAARIDDLGVAQREAQEHGVAARDVGAGDGRPDGVAHRRIRDVEAAIGDGVKDGPRSEEREMYEKGRRSLHARRNISAGERIAEDMLTVKRPGYGISPHEAKKVIGSIAKVDIKADQWITWDML